MKIQKSDNSDNSRSSGDSSSGKSSSAPNNQSDTFVGDLVKLMAPMLIMAPILGLAGAVLMLTINAAHELWWGAIPEISLWHAIRVAAPLTALVYVLTSFSHPFSFGRKAR